MEFVVGHDRIEQPPVRAPRADTAKGYVVTWSDRPECDSPPLDLQQRVLDVARHLARVAPVREQLILHASTCSSECVAPHGGDIVLWIRREVRDGAVIDTASIIAAADGYGRRVIARTVPLGELASRLGRLLRGYMVEGCGKDTFETWVGTLSTGELRHRLGFTRDEAGAD